MGRRAPDVLFIGHGAERSGPPIFLLLLQRWLQANATWRFETVLGAAGELLDDFKELGPVRVVDGAWTPARLAQQTLARSGREGSSVRIRDTRDRLAVRRARRAGLVYVNTLSPETVRLALAVDHARVLVVHAHEMEAGLRYRIPALRLAELLARADHVLAASLAVRDNLVAAHGVPPERVVVHPEHIEPVKALDRDARTVRRVASGLDPAAFIVVGSGRLEWRKAPDLFVELARQVQARRPDRPIEFVWVGGAVDGADYWPIDHDLRTLGLQEVVHFVGHQREPSTWWQLADVFALTSREDAYPLACLEAATAGVPVVTFDTGGMVEFVEGGAGRRIPYPEIGQFADAVLDLAQDREALRRSGEVARRQALEHAVDRSAPHLFAQLERWRDRSAVPA